jgi:L,D-transpeptidase ErfK/SrfK
MQYLVLILLMCFVPMAVVAQDVVTPSLKPDGNQGQLLTIASKPKPNTPKEDQKDNNDYTFSDVVTSDESLNYIGNEIVIKTTFEDSLMELGRTYNVGYVEMVAANPDLNPIFPGEGLDVIIPQRHLIPDAPREGLVINLAEMRLYNFVKNSNRPTSHPIGIGRDGLTTPLGVTKVTRKKDGPSWRPTARMRAEDPELPAVIEPGPDNPLGTHALYLGWPQYLIHGTHKPLGVGRRVSSGCLRMYPEDIIQIFHDIPVGTKVNVIKEPIKIAWIGDMLYIEAHAEDDLADMIESNRRVDDYRVPETLFESLQNISGDAYPRLNWPVIRTAVKNRNGRPIAILKDEVEQDKDNDAIALKENPLIQEINDDEDSLSASKHEKRQKIVLNN